MVTHMQAAREKVRIMQLLCVSLCLIPLCNIHPFESQGACRDVVCGTNAICIEGSCHCKKGFVGDSSTECKAKGVYGYDLYTICIFYQY